MKGQQASGYLRRRTGDGVVDIIPIAAPTESDFSYACENVASSPPCYPAPPCANLRVCRNCISFLLRESQHYTSIRWLGWSIIGGGALVSLGLQVLMIRRLRWYFEGSLELRAVANAVFVFIPMVWLLWIMIRFKQLFQV